MKPILPTILALLLAAGLALAAEPAAPTDRELELRKQMIELQFRNIELEVPRLKAEYDGIVGEVDKRKRGGETKAPGAKKKKQSPGKPTSSGAAAACSP